MEAKENKIGELPRGLASHKVLQVVPTLTSGGVEKTTGEICDALREVGSTPYVATQGGLLMNDLVARGVVWISGPYGTKNPFRMVGNVFRLVQAIKEHGITLVHARSRAPAWSAYFAAYLTKTPFITTFHGTYNGIQGLKKFYNSIMTKGKVVIANSSFIKDHMVSVYGVGATKIRVIPRGVDPMEFDPLRLRRHSQKKSLEPLYELWGFFSQDQRPCLILPGRLTPWKGQKFFIEALQDVDPSSYRAVIIGDAQGRDAYKASLEAQIKEAGLETTIKLVPPSSSMAHVLSHGAAVVSTSQNPEAFGRIMVEALSMEVPVIAGAHGGALEIVDHGKTGLLFSPLSQDEFRRAVQKFLSLSPKVRQKMGKKGRQKVLKDFTTRELCRKTLSVYKDVLQE